MEIYIGNPLNGDKAKVDPQGRLLVASTSFTRYEQASEDGRAFNANTEYVTLTSAGENGVFYMKNTADADVIIEAWFWGVENLSGGTPTGNPVLRAYFNPTGGTLISEATPVAVVNRNGGSSETFEEVIAYKASGTGKTVTGVTDPVLYQLQGSGRSFGTIRLTLPKNSSIAFTFDLAGYGTADVYTGTTGFFKDNND
jgi:hypothetical protein